MLVPVIRALRTAAPGLEPVLMALTVGHARARAMGERPLGYADFLHLTDPDRARAHGRRLLPENTSPDVPEDESLAYLGINYLELEARLGVAGAAKAYAETGRRAFYPLGFFERVIDDLAPAAVISTNAPRSEAAALAAGHGRGLPTVGMVDLFALDTDPYTTRRPRPDLTCVLAPSVRDRLLGHGFPAEGVRVTGNPSFDGLVSPETEAEAAAFRAARGWAGKRVILWAGHEEIATHPDSDVAIGPGLALAAEATLRAYVAARPETALLIRYHPAQWHRFPRQPDSARVHFAVPTDAPAQPQILAADVCVSQGSTVGLEAAIAGKPSITLENAPTALNAFSMAKLGVTTGVWGVEALPAALDAAAGPDRASEFATDGRAADRVAAAILDLVGGG